MSEGRRFSAIVPTRPPMTMIPSSARLMTPECSEKQPPSATSIRTVAESSAYLSIRSILLRLLSVWLFRVRRLAACFLCLPVKSVTMRFLNSSENAQR